MAIEWGHLNLDPHRAGPKRVDPYPALVARNFVRQPMLVVESGWKHWHTVGGWQPVLENVELDLEGEGDAEGLHAYLRLTRDGGCIVYGATWTKHEPRGVHHLTLKNGEWTEAQLDRAA